MRYGIEFNETDGTAAQRAAFDDEWERQFRLLPIDRQEAIISNPMCREVDLLYESVEKENVPVSPR